ncbi:hypothetical protein [Dickeya chrysanthemi]|uniref:hypothetical protein n=1 Tax=Dickeya chrysanthemi TaxID=556 RepID=UPI000586D526|nr:hypothetical protein [Dickeya chrysanthemi]MBX9447760.1 hypothetical protein [Dickeya chrysanthemi]MCA7009519.1 hypothetical protein [Dickeya chrysanthemi]
MALIRTLSEHCARNDSAYLLGMGNGQNNKLWLYIPQIIRETRWPVGGNALKYIVNPGSADESPEKETGIEFYDLLIFVALLNKSEIAQKIAK